MSNRKRVSIQLAYYTLAQWTAWNGVLLSGQVSIVSDAIGDAVRAKIGDGVTTWTALPYYNPASSSQTLQQTLGFGNTTSGNNLIVTTNDEVYFGGLTKFSQGYDGTTLILQDVASSDGIYLDEGGTGLSLKGGGSALDVRNDIDINSAGEIFFTGAFYNFSGLSGNKVTYINNSNHLITTNVVTDNNNLFFPSGYGVDNPTPGDVLNIGGSYASTINIGRAGATVNILGTALYEYAANQYVLDKLITLNYGGAVASGTGVGFEIEENNVITGYLKTNSARNGYELLTPAIAYKSTLSLASLTADRVHTLPNVAGTLATVDGGQTFTSAVWNGTSITTTYTDAKIKGSVAATAGLIAYGTGTADTVTTTSTFKFTGTDLLVGSATPLFTTPVASFTKNQNGNTLYEVVNTTVGTNARVSQLIGESGSRFISLQKYGSTYTGAGTFINFVGTSIPTADVGQLHCAITGTQHSGTMLIGGTPIYNIVGITATNMGSRLDAVGLRIDQIQNIHNAASAALHVVKTTEQLRVGYDASNYYSTTVSSAGAVTFNAVGASAGFIFSDSITMGDAQNMIFNTTTGSKLGESATQKIGKWGVTPIVQPSGANQAAITDSTGGTAGFTLVDSSGGASAINDNFASLARLVDEIRTALVNGGNMKGSA